MIIENITRMGTAILGDIKSVMSGTARMEKPKPVNPCRIAENRKIREPMIKNSTFMKTLKYVMKD